MKLFKTLKAYNQKEAVDTVFGFGLLRAKDYENDIYGHLILLSFNFGVVKMFKLFIKI